MSVVMMVVGAVTPALDPAPAEDEATASDVQAAIRERVVTRGYAANQDFARLSVLTVEVDGQIVMEDAVGQGHIDTLTFKVGAKPAEGNTLLVGDDALTLHPTDSLTIRGFRGKFEFRNMATSQATLALDGTVTRTLLSEGADVKQVRTETASRFTDRALLADGDAGGPAANLPYVILDGRPVQTVSLDPSGVQPLRTAATDGASDGPETAPIFTKWVKIDGELVTRYTWGDGPVERIEFEPAETASRLSHINWSDEPLNLQGNRKVVVAGFIGSYRVTQASGGGMSLDLDGFAKNVTTVVRPLVETLPELGNQPPVAGFGRTPANATTDTTIEFTDLSHDPDGVIVYRKWDFGDGQSTVLQNPRHRYAQPGTYTVRLEATDNNLATSTFDTTVTIGAAPPVSDWDFAPKRPTSLDAVQFIDKSWDSDGTIVGYRWDFGDGTTSQAANPAHQFADNGNYTVTLSVTDVHGLTHNLTKLIQIDNAPPTPDFSYAPDAPLSNTLVNFSDESEDVDGDVVRWLWDFGDGTTSAQQHPVHAYGRSGVFEVTLTVSDNDGAVATYSTDIRIENRAPLPDFTWNPPNVNTTDTVRFTDLSQDVDGEIVSWAWNFGDGTTSNQRNPTHQFRHNATYRICLTVRDDHAQTAYVCKMLGVANSPPIADFTWPTSPIPLALEQVPFRDLSSDVDGDAITTWQWDFGHNNTTSTIQHPNHLFPKADNYPVSLRVTDSKGHVGGVTKSVQILNNRPTASFTATPSVPRVGDLVGFHATADDIDGTIVAYEWTFGDTTGIHCDPSGCTAFGGAELEGNITDGSSVYHTYEAPGNYPVRLTVRDDDGGSVTISRDVKIERAVANADFTWTPDPPTAGKLIKFTGIAEGGDRHIQRWEWTFVGLHKNLTRDVGVVFPTAGTYEVRLRIVDDLGDEDTETKFIYVNDPPLAGFTPNTTLPRLYELVQFTDQSTDSDGFIVSWFWNFGDGSTSTQRHPTHAYSSAGPKVVTLTVTDDAGGTDSLSATVHVDNLGPTPLFDYTPSTPMAGEPVQFQSLSYDPDPHDSITDWGWRFGDGNTSAAQHPNHTYPVSGVYTVSHRVSDGDVWSGIARADVRVGSPYDACYTVKVRTPDGRYLDFSNPQLAVTAVHDRQAASAIVYGDTSFSVDVNGHGALCIPSGTWVRGDVLTFQARLGSAESPFVERHLNREQPLASTVELGLPLRLVPTLTVAPGEKTSEPITFWKGYNETRYPVYHDQTERVHGTGHVDWEDGVPAHDVQVEIQVRYLGVRNLTSNGTVQLQNPVTGWCAADVERTDGGGDYMWELPFTAPCLSPLTAQGVMPPGWWQVRAIASYEIRASHPAARDGMTGNHFFLEDPFGLFTGNLDAGDGSPP